MTASLFQLCDLLWCGWNLLPTTPRDIEGQSTWWTLQCRQWVTIVGSESPIWYTQLGSLKMLKAHQVDFGKLSRFLMISEWETWTAPKISLICFDFNRHSLTISKLGTNVCLKKQEGKNSHRMWHQPKDWQVVNMLPCWNVIDQVCLQRLIRNRNNFLRLVFDSNFFIVFCCLRPFLQPSHCEATQLRKNNNNALATPKRYQHPMMATPRCHLFKKINLCFLKN